MENIKKFIFTEKDFDDFRKLKVVNAVQDRYFTDYHLARTCCELDYSRLNKKIEV